MELPILRVLRVPLGLSQMTHVSMQDAAIQWKALKALASCRQHTQQPHEWHPGLLAEEVAVDVSSKCKLGRARPRGQKCDGGETTAQESTSDSRPLPRPLPLPLCTARRCAGCAGAGRRRRVGPGHIADIAPSRTTHTTLSHNPKRHGGPKSGRELRVPMGGRSGFSTHRSSHGAKTLEASCCYSCRCLSYALSKTMVVALHPRRGASLSLRTSTTPQCWTWPLLLLRTLPSKALSSEAAKANSQAATFGDSCDCDSAVSPV